MDKLNENLQFRTFHDPLIPNILIHYSAHAEYISYLRYKLLTVQHLHFVLTFVACIDFIEATWYNINCLCIK